VTRGDEKKLPGGLQSSKYMLSERRLSSSGAYAANVSEMKDYGLQWLFHRMSIKGKYEDGQNAVSLQAALRGVHEHGNGTKNQIR
jgi:hypothetical protein